MRKISFSCVLFVLCMLAIPFQAAADDYIRGDVNEDGNVSISDVTALIDYLLTDVWPEDQPQEYEIFTVNGIEFKMIKVEGGTFTMGASGTDLEAQDNEFPGHLVTLDTYYIGELEVTQQLWRAVMGSNPSQYTNNLLFPVEMVSWSQCQTFITKLNQITGKRFRMPTEAEWEFAARGGIKSKGYKYSGSNDVDEVAWYSGNSSGCHHVVGTKAPNELGIYDMSGNVWEWCQDWYGAYSANAQVNPTGPTSGSHYVYRGGSFYYYGATVCRVTSRKYTNGSSPGMPWNYLGLRLAMSVQ